MLAANLSLVPFKIPSLFGRSWSFGGANGFSSQNKYYNYGYFEQRYLPIP